MGVKLPVFGTPKGATDWFLICFMAVMTVIPLIAAAYAIYSSILPAIGVR